MRTCGRECVEAMRAHTITITNTHTHAHIHIHRYEGIAVGQVSRVREQVLWIRARLSEHYQPLHTPAARPPLASACASS